MLFIYYKVLLRLLLYPFKFALIFIGYYLIRLVNKCLKIIAKLMGEPEKQVTTKTGLHIKRRLVAHMDLACRNCGAPAVFKNHWSIEKNWPGCYVEEDDPRNNQSVGDFCPNCNNKRPEPVPLGKLWERTI